MDDFLFLRVGYVSSLGGIDIDIDIDKDIPWKSTTILKMVVPFG